MTTYSAIADTTIDQDSPVQEDMLTAMRDNPIAMAEGATDAPVVATGWHPYDAVSVGDGADGEFYDFASDGASGAIETPAFANGYEYAIRFEDFSTAANGNILIEVYGATPATYVTLSTVAVTAPNSLTGFYEIRMPRLSASGHSGFWVVPLSDPTAGVLGSGDDSVAVSGVANSKISKARVSLSLGNTDAGKLFLLRRREYVTG